MSKSKFRKKKAPKRILALPDLEHAKTAVLNSLTSARGQRTYDHAIREFVAWYCSEPRLAFNRTVVLRYRIHLEQRGYAPATINLRRAAVRRRSELLALRVESIQQREEHWVIAWADSSIRPWRLIGSYRLMPRRSWPGPARSLPSRPVSRPGVRVRGPTPNRGPASTRGHRADRIVRVPL